MKVQILSDLHLEHGGALPEHHPEADVIVLAGDLAPCTEGRVDRVAEQWASTPHIVYVLGNHEFYGNEIDDARARLAEECAKAGIHLLDPGTIRIEGVRFIGATLWTDVALDGKADDVGAHMRVSRGISDLCGAIRHRGTRFATGESVRRHRADRSCIERDARTGAPRRRDCRGRHPPRAEPPVHQACPRGLRHSFGVAAVATGVPLPTIAAVLGHASLTTTAIHTTVVGAEARELVSRVWT